MNQKNIPPKNSRVWKYDTVPETMCGEELGTYSTYGIEVSGVGFFETLHDVSTNTATVFGMAELLNRHQLSPVHLWEVVPELISRPL